MKLTRRHLTLAGLVVLGASGLGSAVVAQSGDEAAVNQAAEALRKAMLDADRPRLEALVAAQLSYGHSSGRVETKAQFIDVVAGKKTIYKSITLSDASTSVAGNTAIVRHVYSVETESDGKPGA